MMNRNTKDKLTFGYYFVAFVDLLGQRSQLKKLSFLPQDREGKEYLDFIKIIKETIGAIDDLQNTCKQYFDAFTKEDKNNPFNLIPGMEKLNKTEIKFQHFSDGLVIYVPLRTDSSYSPVRGVYGALVACGSLCLLGLAKKRPVRIGIAISVAAELRDNELYGKAVADAYEMESYVAQYPRVVVANEVLNYLKVYANQKCEKSDIVCNIEAKIAEASLSLLARDYDGHAIVHYLGEFFQKDLMHDTNDVLRKAYAYIDEQLLHHQQSQNSKLAFRYSLLHGYFYEHFGRMIENAGIIHPI